MNEQVTILERLTLVTPLGLRFWDDVTGSVVGDGLSVIAYPPANPARRIPAFANRSGVYVLRDLPGLRAAENGAGDAAFWSSPPAARSFIVEVTDMEGRFQPYTLTASAPSRGLFTLACGPLASPPQPMAGVPLYSAPSRSVPGGMAVLRAELWDAEANAGAGAPAAWALLEAFVDGQPPVRGLADDTGRVALIFPYPEPTGPTLSSPLGATAMSQALEDQAWTVALQAFYARLNPAPALPELQPLPDLCDALMQSPADLWSDSARTIPLPTVTLSYGHEIVVRSRDTSTGLPLSTLLITPAGSPL